MIPQPFDASIIFYVKDIRRTELFYRDTLGLPLKREDGPEPFMLSAQVTPSLQMIFFQLPGIVGNTPAIVFSLKDGASTTSSPA